MPTCPNCDTSLDKSDRFCAFCGSANAECRTTSEDMQKVWRAAQRADQRGDHANGVTLFKQVIHFAPNMLQAYYYLTDCYTNRNEIDQAITTMRQAQALQPGRSTLSFNLDVLEKRNGNLFEARQHVQDAPRLLETGTQVTNRDELRAQTQQMVADM